MPTSDQRAPDRLPRLTPSNLDDEQRAVYDAISGGDRALGTQYFPLQGADGSLHGPFGIMLHAPGVGAALQELGSTIRYRTALEARVREIAILVTARHMDSPFEWWAHERLGRAAGLTDQELVSLASSTFSPADPVEQAATELCDSVLEGAPMEDATYAELRGRLGIRTMIELVTLLGYYRTLADLMRLFEVGVPGDG